MFRVVRTDAANADFHLLIGELDKGLRVTDGEQFDFFTQFNNVDAIRHVILVYDGSTPVGCGAFKEHKPGTVEVKRMFVADAYRRKGIAEMILSNLEIWISELCYTKSVLETGRDMDAALGLYKKNGYVVTENYGQYIGVYRSVCFSKDL